MKKEISLGLPEFLDILFDDNESMHSIKFESVDYSCMDLYKPQVVSVKVGMLLKETDPDETQVKVLLFENHAEVYRRRDWDESASKRKLLKARQDAESVHVRWFKTKHIELTKALAEKQGATPAQTTFLAQEIIKQDCREIAEMVGVDLSDRPKECNNKIYLRL